MKKKKMHADVVESRQPPKMAVREARTVRLIGDLSHMADVLTALRGDNIHLTDVTTCPGDFERVKRMIFDIVNELLAELDNAGVLEQPGKDKRQRLMFLDGGRS